MKPFPGNIEHLLGPIVRQQIVELFLRCIGDSGENIPEPLEGINIPGIAAGHHGVENS